MDNNTCKNCNKCNSVSNYKENIYYLHKTFNLELMITLACNLRCKYCSGKTGLLSPFKLNESKMQRKVFDKVLQEIDNIQEKKYFKNKYDILNIMIFGGEPVLAIDYIEELLERYKDNDKIMFKLITNGTNFSKLHNVIEKYANIRISNGEPKFYVQISYDGNPIHDIKRLDINGKPTSHIVKESIKYMQDNNYIYSLKSTITYDTFKYMYDSYLDYLDVAKENLEYFPTIDISDYCSTLILSEEMQKEYYSDLENSLIKIAKNELKDKKNNSNNYFTKFKWFTNNRSLCSVGTGYFTVNIDGKLYPCHANTYNNTHSIGSILDDNYEDYIVAMNDKFVNLKGESLDCKNCDANFCLRCQMNVYSMSKKENDNDKYIDYAHNKFRCSLYQLSSKIKRALEFF